MLKQSLMLAAATLALAACNKPASETAADTTASAGNAVESAGTAIGNAGADMSPAMATPTAAEFVQKAGISDMYEIEASKLAQKMSKSTAITKFAGQMIADHTATTAKIKSITAGDAALKPPAAMDEKHQQLIADLKAAGPDKFDALYVDQQTDAHQEAHALMESYASGGDNAKLKEFATATAPKIQMHLDMVKQIDHSGVPDSQAGNADAKTGG